MKVDITPDVSLLRKSGEVNYRLPDALAELVDNSVDALIPGSKLHVDVKLSQRGGQKHVVVADDGCGMTLGEAKKAMVMAHSKKKRGKIGEFGLGMKTACANLGAHFEIVTATSNAAKAIKIQYDEEEFLKNGTWHIDLEEIKKPFDHGTQITITKLKVNLYAGTKDTVLNKFGKIFKHFVASGDAEIVVNETPVLPLYRETLNEYDVSIDFEVGGKGVRGFATLLAQGAPTTGYGLTLIRHNRLVSENEKLGFSATSSLTRLYGELHLDDWPVNNNKTDFRRDTPEWDEMVRKLNEDYLAELKRESRRKANPGRLKGKDKAEVDTWTEDIKKALKSDELQQDLDRRALDVALGDEFAEGAVPFELPGEKDERGEASEAGTYVDGKHSQPPSVEEHRLGRVKTQLRNLEIESEVASLGRDSLYKIWHVEGVGPRKRLIVTSNSDHPFYQAIEADFVLWIKHNIIESVAEFFTESTGTAEAMLLVKSDIMKRVSQMKLAEMDLPEPGEGVVAQETAS